MSLSPVQNAEPPRDINRDGQPYSVAEIMRGPHLRELLTEEPVAAVMVEPLRFIAPVRLAGRDVFAEPSA